MSGSGSEYPGRRARIVLLSLLMGGAILVVALALVPRAMFCSPAGKVRIAMCGRSTMDQWFKSWNWPHLLHRFAIWRNWPIPYRRYARGGYYFELVPVPGPAFSIASEENGREMLEAIARSCGAQDFDAIFFKFCFVDFDEPGMSEEARKVRLSQMVAIVTKVGELARSRGQRLILGTALPVQRPEVQPLELRREFSAWVEAFGRSNPDVAVVDLYNPLVDSEGKMKLEFARNTYDDHVNWKGFKRLDQELVSSLESLYARAPAGL